MLKARGRNGSFLAKTATVTVSGEEVSIGIASKRSGRNDPIIISGTQNEVSSLLEALLEAVWGQPISLYKSIEL